MKLIKSVSLATVFFIGQSPVLLAENKLSCASVDAIQAKCTEYDTDAKSCSDIVQAAIKGKVDAAKQEQNDCKSKYGATYMLKCKSEIKKATTLVNTPNAVLKSTVEKEQIAVAESPCAKAEAIGKEQVLCKGPKKVVESMKTNCVKDI